MTRQWSSAQGDDEGMQWGSVERNNKVVWWSSEEVVWQGGSRSKQCDKATGRGNMPRQ
jgi:hypothetical protein